MIYGVSKTFNIQRSDFTDFQSIAKRLANKLHVSVSFNKDETGTILNLYGKFYSVQYVIDELSNLYQLEN